MKRIWVLTLAVSALSCSRCGKQTAATPTAIEALLPRSAQAVVVVPKVGALGTRVAALEKLKVAAFIAQLQGFADAHAWGSAVMQALGFDVRSHEALTEGGIDPNGAGAAVSFADGTGFVAVPVLRPERFQTLLRNLARNRLAAGFLSERKEGGFSIATFATKEGESPKLAMLVRGAHALVAAEGSVPKLLSWASLPVADSLATEAALGAAADALRGAHAWAYFPNGPPPRLGIPLPNLLVTAMLENDTVTFRARAPWQGDVKNLALLERQADAAAPSRYPADVFMVANFAGDPSALSPWLRPMLGRFASAAMADAGFDVREQVLAHMRPGVSVALSLAPTAKLSAGMPAFDVRRTNPFVYAHLIGFAHARDAGALPATLNAVADVAPRFGARVQRESLVGRDVFITTYAQGEGVHFASDGAQVTFGSPRARLAMMLMPDAGVVWPLAASLKAQNAEHALVATVDLHRLADAVRALPSEAWGLGGFAIKNTTVRWLDATDDLLAVTLSADAKGTVLEAQAQLQLKAGAMP